MKAMLVAVAILAGCGTDGDDHSDLHEQATCSGWTKSDGSPWTELTKCERACATPPPLSPDDEHSPKCWTSANAPIGGTPVPYFEFEGVNGACEQDVGQPTSTGAMSFYECQTYPN